MDAHRKERQGAASAIKKELLCLSMDLQEQRIYSKTLDMRPKTWTSGETLATFLSHTQGNFALFFKKTNIELRSSQRFRGTLYF